MISTSIIRLFQCGVLFSLATAMPKWMREECPGRRTHKQRSSLSKCVNWKLGVEQESMIVHRMEDGLDEFVVPVFTVGLNMKRYARIYGAGDRGSDAMFELIETGVEPSGRNCANLKSFNFNSMSEAVSSDVDENTFDNAYCEVYNLRKEYLKAFRKQPSERKASEFIGKIRYPRFGMGSMLGQYTTAKGKIWTCSCGSCPLKDYTGSVHISVSLPVTPHGSIASDPYILKDRDTCSSMGGNNTTLDEEDGRRSWVDAHINFSNMVQWMEPLLVAVLGAPDHDAVCDNGIYTEGSFRSMRTGWGLPGVTNVSTFHTTGWSRYSRTGFEWVNDMNLSYMDDLKGCFSEGMGTDIRTIRNKEDEMENLPMKTGYGVEFRFFDNLSRDSFVFAYRMIALIAEASRTRPTDVYIYESEGWSDSIKSVMEEGWNAIVSPEYVEHMKDIFGLELIGLGENLQASNVLESVFDELWGKHRSGMWTNLLLDHIPKKTPYIPNENRKGWEFSANNIFHVSTVDAFIELFVNELVFDIVYCIEQLELVDPSCGEDLQDLLYLGETLGFIEIEEFSNVGEIERVVIRDIDIIPKELMCTTVVREDTCGRCSTEEEEFVEEEEEEYYTHGKKKKYGFVDEMDFVDEEEAEYYTRGKKKKYGFADEMDFVDEEEAEYYVQGKKKF